jgi:hypothetical protein
MLGFDSQAANPASHSESIAVFGESLVLSLSVHLKLTP